MRRSTRDVLSMLPAGASCVIGEDMTTVGHIVSSSPTHLQNKLAVALDIDDTVFQSNYKQFDDGHKVRCNHS